MSERILIVDDDPVQRRLLDNMVRKFGYEPVVAEGGDAAAAVLAGAGASFLLLGAEFVGITQILVYIGAIVVLFLFGIMLTRAPIGRELRLTNSNWIRGGVVALAIAGVLGYTLIDAFGSDKLPDTSPQTTAQVSDSIFSTYLVPFEVVSVLLLAALVGAIVLARKE